MKTRRDFLTKAALAAVAVAGADVSILAAGHEPRKTGSTAALPWFRRVLRWGQTNITELDPTRYDIEWWRGYWRRTQTQGVIINAGGIDAYYPSSVPLHRPAQFLGGRDLFGELCRAAHQDGLAVFARMDSNRAHEDLYQAHPDWFAVDSMGKPHRAGELYIACVNSPYYRDHIPAILRKLVERYRPEGFTDNSWSGPGRATICYCENCREGFHQWAGSEIPQQKNWNDTVYRKWIQWNYARRLEIWDQNNHVTQAAGGPDCLWVGMNSGSLISQAQSFRDSKEICRRAALIMLDHQSRNDAGGFQNNGEAGKLMHGLLGWDKLVPESMAMYQAGRPTFRLASKPAAEARLWMLEGIAGGLQPWWHHVGAYQEDRRMFHTAEPILRWHQANEQFLVNRRPTASVGVVWSQQNIDFYGRDDPEALVELPWRGLTQALIRARIPYLPIHADHLERDAAQFAVLVLPNLGAMSDRHVESIRRFVERGGGLLATGEASLFDEWGDPRADFALADLLGAHITKPRRPPDETERRKRANETLHTYLRLVPELRAQTDGPRVGNEPAITAARHPVLHGFEETDILPFGGTLGPLAVQAGAEVLATFVPSFPIYPPETAWMREANTHIPGLILSGHAQGGRVVFLPADLDRRFARDNLPDHGDLLAALVRWTARDNIPLFVEGPGLIDCHLYRQPGRMILHLVNLTNAGTWRQPVQELIPLGPLQVKLRLAADVAHGPVRLLVTGNKARTRIVRDWLHLTLNSVLDHELIVIG